MNSTARNSKEIQIETMLDYESGLRCLARFMKREIRTTILGRPRRWVDRYVLCYLNIIDQCVEPAASITDSNMQSFPELCRQFRGASGPRTITTYLNQPLCDDYPYFAWEEWARNAGTIQDWSMMLYCQSHALIQLGIQWGLPGPRHYRESLDLWAQNDYQGEFPIRTSEEYQNLEADRILALSNALCQMGQSDLALRVIEMSSEIHSDNLSDAWPSIPLEFQWTRSDSQPDQLSSLRNAS